MTPLTLFVVIAMALFYGYLADHAYTVWLKGRIPRKLSHCDGCGGRLNWEMTPVLGYLLTHGRCWRRDCDLIIPPAYPLIEIAGALVGIAAAPLVLRAGPDPIVSAFLLAGMAIGYVVAVAGALILHRLAPPRG
jgi:prepilin signal peptidase PulO-like enzyme (type II secretory pathway)